VADPAQQLGGRLQLGLLVRLERDLDRPARLEPALDPVALDVGPHPGVVLLPEALERLHLLGETGEAVGDAMGEGGVDEAAVATARGAADLLRLEQDDVAPGVVGLGVQGGPEAGEAAADDAEVGLGRPGQRRGRPARRERADPERSRLGVGVAGAVGAARRPV
jgi:hypothetical protein